MAWTMGRQMSSIFTFKGRVRYVLKWVPAGLLFGIMTTFQWQRAVHRPLVFITLAATAALLLSPLILRNEAHH